MQVVLTTYDSTCFSPSGLAPHEAVRFQSEISLNLVNKKMPGGSRNAMQ